MRPHIVDLRSAIAAIGCTLGVAVALQIVRHQGLLAISDDDYARVVIAQEFAANPRWDPSATSWLPLPFWITGTSLLAWGASLAHARAVTVAFNALCCGVLWALGRNLGLDRGQSVCLTFAAALLPSALWLGAAPIPEFSTAILLTISCLSLLASPSSWWRIGGGCATAFACASRYEAWPVALGVAGYNGWDVVRALGSRGAHTARLMLACGACLVFPVVWLLHGVLHHGDALFFVERVSKYRAALGHGLPGLRQLIAGYPRALVVVEPLAMAWGLSAVGLAITQRRGDPAARKVDPARPSAARVVVLLAVQVFVLVISEARGGSPTHHPERALLGVWTTTVFLAGYVWCTRSSICTGRYLATVSALCLLTAHLFAPWATRLTESRLRAPEEEGGRKLASLHPTETVGIVTKDYGYFAIMAAAGTPARFKIWSRHDPRQQRAPVALPAWINEHAITLLVAPSDTVIGRKPSAQLNLVSGRQAQQFVLYSIKH